MSRKNEDIRAEAKMAGVTLWQIAERWKGVSEQTIIRWMRHELTPAQKDEIRQVIEQIKQENADE